MTDNDDGGVMPLAGRLLGLLADAAFWPDDAIGPRLAAEDAPHNPCGAGRQQRPLPERIVRL